MSDAEQRYLRISVTNKWNTMNMSLESHFYLKCTSRTGFSPCLRPETELDSSCSKGFLLRPTCVYHRRAVTVIASPCFKIRFWERTMLIINTIIMSWKWGLRTLEQVTFRKLFRKINPKISGHQIEISVQQKWIN